MLKKGLLLATSIALLSASSTMCFKKEHQDPSNIEQTPLDGGECKSVKTVKDMEKEGYVVEDIKITSGNTGLNYIYIFKQPTISSGNGVVVGNRIMTKAQLKEYLTEINKEEEARKAKEEAEGSLELGKKIYTSKCFRCHGLKGDVRAYNSARALNTLSVDQIKVALRDYESGDKDNGMAMIMRPYAAQLDSKDIKSVANYIQTLRKK